MKRRFSEEQIVGILGEHAAGGTVTGDHPAHGVSEQSFYRWKAKHAGLKVRKSKRKRISQGERPPWAVPQAPGERWSMDFQHDMLASGRRFRTFNIGDDVSRACPAIEVDIPLPGARALRVLDRLAETRGLPTAIGLDNRPRRCACWRLTVGPIDTAFAWPSLSLACRTRMLLWNPSTAGSGTSA